MKSNHILNRSIWMILLLFFFVSCASSNKPTETPQFSQIKSVQEAAEQTKKLPDTFDGSKLAPETAEKIKKDVPFSDITSAASNIPPPQNIDELPTYGTWLDRLMGKVLRVESKVESGANQNFPIVLSLVFVKDPSIYSTLTTITARDWFRKDQQKIEALKKQKNLLEIRDITVLPEQQTYFYLVRAPSHIKAGLLFVRLIGNVNLYPTLFDPYQDLFLEFSANNFTIQQESDK